MAISDEIKEFLESIGKSISKEAADILSTVIGKDVVISMNKISELDMKELISLYPPDVLSVRFNVSDKPEDIIYVLFEKDIAVKISSLMIMESDEGVEFSEEKHLDSIEETANQILEHLSSVLSEELKKRVEFFSTKAEVLKLEPNLFDIPKPVLLEYSLNMGHNQERKVTKILSSETIERFLKGEEETESGEEVPSEEAESTEVKLEDSIPQEGKGKAEEEEEVPSEEAESTEVKLEDSIPQEEKEKAEEEEEVPSEEAESSEIKLEDSIPQVEEEEAEEGEDITTREPQLPEEMTEKIGLLMNLSLPITIELGRTRMLIKDILELGHGSVIEFDKLAGEPVDLLINDKKVAEGEVVVIDEHFGIRLTNLIKPSERIKNLGK